MSRSLALVLDRAGAGAAIGGDEAACAETDAAAGIGASMGTVIGASMGTVMGVGVGVPDGQVLPDPRCLAHPDCSIQPQSHEQGDDLSGCAPIPQDPAGLPSEDLEHLYVEERSAWPQLADDQRARLLLRCRERHASLQARIARQREREQACMSYVEALMEVGRLSGQEREVARVRLDAARTHWYAIRRRRR